MEVAGAGQWRREWAGTAEYGKVTEGGVTRRVARAMEVLNASAPGARMRVVRAAYHQSASSGAPAASYLMHSSRTVISSGFNNMIERPTFPSKPLEISSTPLESSPEPNTDTENYKVTEPDDFDISEPSKWRSGSGRTSIRMPSEESSSTDNASIIDLDARHKNIQRKYSYDSDIEVPPYRRNSSNSSRFSPLLDTPVALSTLKYKSLLNGGNDWNNRRKSYSFEDTSPLKETVTQSNDTLAMESSTDSGICKSTEIVNDPDDKYTDRKERSNDKQEESFKDWLFKNRSNSSFYKGSPVRSLKSDVVIEEPGENNIALHSTRKVSIRTVPIAVAEDYQYNDTDRRIKKVGFSKTELHFAVDSGKVNIIETDEKPPPSNDFRKRRSAFVPLQGACDKPITLFGDNTREISEAGTTLFTNTSTNENSDFEENTAATKSILKNKIPKPKPYLLGENMIFGTSSDLISKDTNYDTNVPTAVSLINKQLELEKRGSEETTTSFSAKINSNVINKAYRTTHTGPFKNGSLKFKNAFERESIKPTHQNENTPASKNKFNIPEISPKTRQLRNSDLAYFGVTNGPKNFESSMKRDTRSASSSIDDLFQSVRLVQSVTNSACNSETESEDKPEYQNIPFKTHFAPVPTPRPRSKYDTDKEVKLLRPIIEQETATNIDLSETRRSRLRRQEDSFHSRSISEPRKSSRYNSMEKPRGRHDYTRSKKTGVIEDSSLRKVLPEKPSIVIKEEEEPTYVNFNVVKGNDEITPQRSNSIRHKSDKMQNKTENLKGSKESNAGYVRPRSRNYNKNDEAVVNTVNKHSKENDKNDVEMRRLKKIRTEKLATPEYNNEQVILKKPSTTNRSNILDRNSTTRNSKHERRDDLSLKNSRKPKHDTSSVDNVNKSLTNKKELQHKEVENDTFKQRTSISSKDRSGRRESSSTRRQAEKNSTISRNKEDKVINIPIISNPKSDDYKSSKRSEYVIKYDDKEGTVSSICKVKPGTGSYKSRKAAKEHIKDSKSKHKTTEKIALLQLPGHQWDPYETNYAESKWKRKLHAQRSCQLL